MKQNRLVYLDIAKGVAMLLVIFGHTFRESMRADFYWCDFSYLFVYKFHVSLFFLISGISYALTIKKYLLGTTGNYIKKKTKSVLLPWFSYSVLIYLIFFVASFVPQIGPMLGERKNPLEYLKLMLFNENPYAFHLWFLNTLFIFLIICFFIDKFTSGRVNLIIKISLIVIAPIIYSFVAKDFVWVFKAVFQKLPFFFLGTMIKPITDKNKAKLWSVAGLLCGALIAAYTVFEPNLSKNINSEFIWMLIMYVECAVVALFSYGIINVCYLIQNIRIFSLIESIGRNSNRYYLYHQPFCCAFVGIFLYDKLHLPVILVVVACMVLGVVLPYLLVKLLRILKLDKWVKKLGLPA